MIFLFWIVAYLFCGFGTLYLIMVNFDDFIDHENMDGDSFMGSGMIIICWPIALTVILSVLAVKKVGQLADQNKNKKG